MAASDLKQVRTKLMHIGDALAQRCLKEIQAAS
jgi:hypothetical protein